MYHQTNGVKLGSHIGKFSSYYKTIIDFETNMTYLNPDFDIQLFPIQIFTGSTKMWKRANIENEAAIKDLDKTKKYVESKDILIFIHSIYLINLARIGSEFEKAKNCLTYDLKLGPKIGCKGVVVHVAKALKMGTELALNNMFKNILNLLPDIDPSCPLLIETPAGQGTEVLTDINDFSTFYDRFDSEQKLKVKICIDTCHVFASGYDPAEYLEKWNELQPDSIVLVHYNDSKCECGSKKDRHAPAGEGHIGLEKLDYITKWCATLNIPMVREY
jgi:deoxyribonuclease IV